MNGIELIKVNKSYKKKCVLEDISLGISRGSIYGLLGPSGCGKTTTVKIIAGILGCDSGTVKVNGMLVPDIRIMGTVGYMAQSDALYTTLSALENLRFFGKLYGLDGKELDARIKYVSRIVGLTQDLGTRTENYSGGMRRRLSLALALLSDPEVLLLDEPTVGIDPLLRESIWKELRKLSADGTTILVTTHVMDEAAKCDRLAMMRGGKIIAEGAPCEITNATGCKTLEEAFILLGKEHAPDEN